MVGLLELWNGTVETGRERATNLFRLRDTRWSGLDKMMTIKEGEICLACSQSYPPNGILFCDDCGMDKDMEQQREREGDNA